MLLCNVYNYLHLFGRSNACGFCGTICEETIRIFPNLNAKSHQQEILEEGFAKIVNGFKIMSNMQMCESQSAIQNFCEVLEEMEATTIPETTLHQIKNDLRKACVHLLHMKELRQKQKLKIHILKLQLKQAKQNNRLRRLKQRNGYLRRNERSPNGHWTIT